MTYPGLIVEDEGAIRIVTLDRADSFNALDVPLIEALTRCFQNLCDRQDIRVVLLRANGKHFCAGVNLKGWKDEIAEPSIVDSLRMQRRIVNIIRLMRACPQPVIVLGHGAAAGGGFSLMLGSDVRFGTPDLRMNAAYIKVGLGGCDIGSSYFLPRLVGSSIASELLLTGRFLNAERALRLGLLSDVVEPEALLETGLSLAREMLAVAPLALSLTKDVLNVNIDAPGFEAAVALEDRQQVMLTTTADHGEAVSAFLEKRSPNFTAC
ncbi:enoyl-CoA hydratase/isomerase family protein [Sphingomonas colocasiae]|uniref:Enoyl-CoA hydratase/isomerase family protein n=2 Tax=Sphingomonas colocasiae TaxID=1848973 RepID=A0ABS7PSN6_9SPHN|nr:enoyl-CoA hydratase/isomerase family protein [Sphingomonas colocasiae]